MIIKLIAIVLSLLINAAMLAWLNNWSANTVVVDVTLPDADAKPNLRTITMRNQPFSPEDGRFVSPMAPTITTLPTITVHPTPAQIESLRRERGQPR